MSTQWEPDEAEWQLWGDPGRRVGCLPLVVLAAVFAVPWLAVWAIVAMFVEMSR